MASSKIVYNQPINFQSADLKYSEEAKIFYKSGDAKISSKRFYVGSIKESNFYDGKVLQSKRIVKVSQKLPFYIRFENVGISAYGPSNPAPIGIAVIGGNNWIL